MCIYIYIITTVYTYIYIHTQTYTYTHTYIYISKYGDNLGDLLTNVIDLLPSVGSRTADRGRGCSSHLPCRVARGWEMGRTSAPLFPTPRVHFLVAAFGTESTVPSNRTACNGVCQRYPSCNEIEHIWKLGWEHACPIVAFRGLPGASARVYRSWTGKLYHTQMLDMFNTCINAALLNLRKHVKQKEHIFTSRYPISRCLTHGKINHHRFDALSVMWRKSENKDLLSFIIC